MPEQSVRPAPHETTQRPPAQVWPAGHTVPHAPQFDESVESVTHTPRHAVCPVGHDSVHALDTHA